MPTNERTGGDTEQTPDTDAYVIIGASSSLICQKCQGSGWVRRQGTCSWFACVDGFVWWPERGKLRCITCWDRCESCTPTTGSEPTANVHNGPVSDDTVR